MKAWAVAANIFLASLALAGSRPSDGHNQGQDERVEERLVFVTGSLIPRRIQLRRVGTTTESPLRIIDRAEIDQTGRLTTAGAFINDPSVRIINFR